MRTTFKIYEKIEKYLLKRQDFINKFERLLYKTKQYGWNMSADILAYQLLKAANFSKYHEQLTRATIFNLNYDAIKTQLKKIFRDNPSACHSLKNPSFAASFRIKFDTINETNHEEVL